MLLNNRSVLLFLLLAFVLLNFYFYFYLLGNKNEAETSDFLPICVDLKIKGSPFSHTCHLRLFIDLTYAEIWGIETPNVSLPMSFTVGQFTDLKMQKAPTAMIDNALATIKIGSRNPLDPPEFTASSNTTLVFDTETVLLYNCMPNFYHFLKGCLLPYYVALNVTGRLELPHYNPHLFMVSDYPFNVTLKNRKLYSQWFPNSNPILYRIDYMYRQDSRLIYFSNAWIGSYSLNYGIQESPEILMSFRQWYMTKMGYPPKIDFGQKATKGYILLSNRKTKRFIVNYNEVKAALEPFGNLKEVYFEDIDMKEAMALMEKTSIFIGIYGAGMMNLMWGRKGLDVIEFRGSKLIADEMFLGFTKLLDMNHHLMNMKPVYFHNYTCSGVVEDCESGKAVLPKSCCYYFLLMASVSVDVPQLVELVTDILKRKEIDGKD